MSRNFELENADLHQDIDRLTKELSTANLALKLARAGHDQAHLAGVKLREERDELQAANGVLRAKLINDYDDDLGAGGGTKSEPVLPCEFIVGATHFHAGVQVRLAQDCANRLYAELKKHLPAARTLDEFLAEIDKALATTEKP